MHRVLAQAIVDEITSGGVDADPVFRVEVWGQEPHDFTRTYEIAAKSDNIAAQQGIQRFTDEMEALSAE